jgi:hypothetical protein
MEEINIDVSEDEIKDLTQEERAQAWSNWIRAGVNSYLDVFLPEAKDGNINVIYKPHVIEIQECNTLLDKDKADGVVITLDFNFEKPVDLKKPIE